MAAVRSGQLSASRSGGLIPAAGFETDGILRRLVALGNVLILPLARAAAVLAQHTAWQACGFRTQAHFARECLGRDSRWLRQLVYLHRALERLPALAEAITGADGGRPVGQVAALLLSRVATPEDVGSWIARARELPLQELREAIHSASAEQPLSSSLSDESGLDEPSQVRLRFSVPPDVRWIFEAGLDLYRSVEGWEAGISGFAAALVAEATSSGCVPPDGFRPRWRSQGRAGEEGEVPRETAAEAERPGALQGDGQRAPQRRGDPLAAGSHHGTWNGRAIVLAPHTPAMGRALERLERYELLRSRLRRLEGKLDLLPEPGSKMRTRDLRELVDVLQALVRMQDEIQIDMADLLLELHDRRMWKALGFVSLEAYAEGRLGMGGSTAHQRVGLARRLPRLGIVREAYATGQIGAEAAGHVVRRMQRLPADEALQRQWLAHVVSLTVKRLRDEDRLEHRRLLLAQVALACAMTPGYSAAATSPGAARQGESGEIDDPCHSSRRFPVGENIGTDPKFATRSVTAACQNSGRFPLGEDVGTDPKPTSSGPRRSRSGNPTLPPPVPLDDATWRRALRRHPGEICTETFALAYGLLERVVRKGPLLQVPLVLTLPEDDAIALQGCIEAARRSLSHPDDDSLSPAADSHLPPSARIARQFVRRHERVPDWVGLLALLEEWALEHDGREQRVHPIFARDAGRCMAPGCTARASLEVHHLHYRGQGGSDDPENLILLCAFHHRQGEHGGLARCRGKAPLDVLWRLGRSELGVRYKNERRLPSSVSLVGGRTGRGGEPTR